MAVNWLNFKKARQKLIDNISIPQYYRDFKDPHVDIEAKTLAPCPMHDETLGSFQFHPDTKSCNCYGCGKGGDIVNLHTYVMERERDEYSQVKAVLDLAKLYEIDIPDIFGDSEVTIHEVASEKKEAVKHARTRGSYPPKWLSSQIEKVLQKIKLENIDMYKDLCEEKDLLMLIDVDLQEKLLDFYNKVQDILEDI